MSARGIRWADDDGGDDLNDRVRPSDNNDDDGDGDGPAVWGAKACTFLTARDDDDDDDDDDGGAAHRPKRQKRASMDAETLTIRELYLGGSVVSRVRAGHAVAELAPRFEIPIYQRRYCWTEPLWRQLWDDAMAVEAEGDDFLPHILSRILLTTERSTADAADAWEPVNEAATDHSAPSTAGADEVLTIIDGQQRMTTVFILLSAIRAKFVAEGLGEGEAVAEIDAIMLTNQPSSTAATTYALTPTHFDVPWFAGAVSGELPPAFEARANDSPLVRARRYFDRLIAERLSGLQGSEARAASLRFLLHTVVDRLAVVVLLLHDHSGSAEDAFETFSRSSEFARCFWLLQVVREGQAIASSDLVRNLILSAVKDKAARLRLHLRWLELEHAVLLGNDHGDEPGGARADANSIEAMSDALVAVDGAASGAVLDNFFLAFLRQVWKAPEPAPLTIGNLTILAAQAGHPAVIDDDNDDGGGVDDGVDGCVDGDVDGGGSEQRTAVSPLLVSYPTFALAFADRSRSRGASKSKTDFVEDVIEELIAFVPVWAATTRRSS